MYWILDSRYWIGFFNDQLLILVTYSYIFVSKIFYQESSIENRASSINPVNPVILSSFFCHTTIVVI